MTFLGAYLLIGIATAMAMAVWLRHEQSWLDALPDNVPWWAVSFYVAIGLSADVVMWPITWAQVYDGGRWKG